MIQLGINIMDETISFGQNRGTMQTQTMPVESAIKSLPEAIQKGLSEHIAHIGDIRYLIADGKPKPEWRVSYGRSLAEAMGKAIREVQRATGSPSWDSVLVGGRESLWNYQQKRALDALMHAAGKAGRSEASAAARNRAWSAAMEAVWEKARSESWNEMKARVRADGNTIKKSYALVLQAKGIARAVTMGAAEAAALKAKAILVSDQDFIFKEMHAQYADRVMEVYEKGYFLASEVRGLFFVGCVGDPPPEQLKLRM